jgi:hypothetical protein
MERAVELPIPEASHVGQQSSVSGVHLEEVRAARDVIDQLL